MNKSIISIFIILTLSCVDKYDKNIQLLASNVGENNFAIIEKLVEDFETYLQTKYPENNTIDISYNQYLKAIASDTTTLEPFMSIETHKQFITNDLFYEKNRNSLVFNHNSLYMIALSIIAEQDPVVNEYYKVKQKAGLLQNTLFANGFLATNPNFNNNIHRIIVVLELSY